MPISFSPKYTITPKIMNALLRIEVAREKISHFSFPSTSLDSLKEKNRFYTIHYAAGIEGKYLDLSLIEQAIKENQPYTLDRVDLHEIKGYYIALIQIEKWAEVDVKLTEMIVQILHALALARHMSPVKPTPYRDTQTVVRDYKTKAVVYMPPEAKDVRDMMEALINWVNQNRDLPYPILAGLAHYQFLTIHPYEEANGRAARLLSTFILYWGGYHLKGLYSLEEYYAQHVQDYYEALNISEFHNYYMGRADADITKWLEYFVEGLAISCENAVKRLTREAPIDCLSSDNSAKNKRSVIRMLNIRQRKALKLFQNFEVITSRQIGELFQFRPRTSAALCAQWVEQGFLEIVDGSNKGRKYKLGSRYSALIQ